MISQTLLLAVFSKRTEAESFPAERCISLLGDVVPMPRLPPDVRRIRSEPPDVKLIPSCPKTPKPSLFAPSWSLAAKPTPPLAEGAKLGRSVI